MPDIPSTSPYSFLTITTCSRQSHCVVLSPSPGHSSNGRKERLLVEAVTPLRFISPLHRAWPQVASPAQRCTFYVAHAGERVEVSYTGRNLFCPIRRTHLVRLWELLEQAKDGGGFALAPSALTVRMRLALGQRHENHIPLLYMVSFGPHSVSKLASLLVAVTVPHSLAGCLRADGRTLAHRENPSRR